MKNPLASLIDLAMALAGYSAAPAPSASSDPYRSGEINRLNRTWQPHSWAADDALNLNWDLSTARARDLARNDPPIIALRDCLVDHIVGSGLQTMANVMAADQLLEDFCFESDELFEEWALYEADAAGELSWYDMQRQAFFEMLDTGDAFLIRVARNDPDRRLPLCYQAVEAEQLDTGKDRPATNGRNAIRRGIEVDPLGRHVAYHFFGAHPHDSYASTFASSPVPAERVIHLRAPGRPNATRGISLYQAVTQPARDSDTYLGSELTAGIIGSLLTLIHKTANPGSGLGLYPQADTATDTDMADGSNRVRLGRGIVAQIGQDDDVSVAESNRPNRDAGAFIRLIQTLIGQGGGVSRYRLTRDYSGTTYVAGRAARLDDQAHFEPLQKYFARRLVLPVRHAWTATAAAYGLFQSLSPTLFARQRRRWSRVEVLPPAVEDLDPEKATDARLAALAAGTTTYQKIWAQQGGNWRRGFQQLAREKAYADSLKLQLSYDRPSTPARQEQSTPDPTGAEN